MRVSFVTTSLSCGGAERAVVLLAEGFIQKGIKVDVITLAGKDDDFYTLSNDVNRVALDITGKSPTPVHAIGNNLYRLRILRKTICSLKPDLVISVLYTANILTLLSLSQTKFIVIANEQNNPTASLNNLWKVLQRFTYPKASKVVSISKGVNAYFDWLPTKKKSVIYNPLTSINDDKNIVNLPLNIDPNKKWIVAMGRLVEQKNFNMLLSAFHKIADKYPDWQLLIIGEGELRCQLEELRDKLGLTNQVFFPGRINNPFPILKESELFVLSSRYEGLAMVLLEAMACGLPIISTDCPSGRSEIIRDGIDGILVPNEDLSALTTAMDRLMSNEEQRKRLAIRAPEVKQRFGLEKIVAQWEALINELVQEKNHYV